MTEPLTNADIEDFKLRLRQLESEIESRATFETAARAIALLSPMVGKLLAERERLEVIVADLPELADGVPVTPALIGEDVWTWAAETPLTCFNVEWIELMEYDTQLHGSDEWGNEYTVAVEDCSSTEAAARAAGEPGT